MTAATAVAVPTNEALRAAIAAQPKEDTPRLVYADWLQENGEEDRAEFIRDQIWLAVSHATRVKSSTANRRRWNRVGRCLTKLHYVLSWCPYLAQAGGHISSEEELKAGELHCLFKRATGYAIFRRGFVDEVECDADSWMAHADEATAYHPIRAVTLTTRPVFHDARGNWNLRTRTQDVSATVAGVHIKLPPINEEDDPSCHLLAARWPGIKFTLPPWNRYVEPIAQE